MLRLQPGDILVVEVKDVELDEGGAVDTFDRAIAAAGLGGKVACILHDGKIEMSVIRAECS